MKKLKLSLAALAIIVSVGGAMATHASSHKTTDDPEILHWYANTTGTGTREDATMDDEIDATGCSGNAAFCRNGYTTSQYVNGNVALGLAPGQAAHPAQVLHHP